MALARRHRSPHTPATAGSLSRERTPATPAAAIATSTPAPPRPADISFGRRYAALDPRVTPPASRSGTDALPTFHVHLHEPVYPALQHRIQLPGGASGSSAPISRFSAPAASLTGPTPPAVSPEEDAHRRIASRLARLAQLLPSSSESEPDTDAAPELPHVRPHIAPAPVAAPFVHIPRPPSYASFHANVLAATPPKPASSVPDTLHAEHTHSLALAPRVTGTPRTPTQVVLSLLRIPRIRNSISRLAAHACGARIRSVVAPTRAHMRSMREQLNVLVEDVRHAQVALKSLRDGLQLLKSLLYATDVPAAARRACDRACVRVDAWTHACTHASAHASASRDAHGVARIRYAAEMVSHVLSVSMHAVAASEDVLFLQGELQSVDPVSDTATRISVQQLKLFSHMQGVCAALLAACNACATCYCLCNDVPAITPHARSQGSQSALTILRSYARVCASVSDGMCSNVADMSSAASRLRSCDSALKRARDIHVRGVRIAPETSATTTYVAPAAHHSIQAVSTVPAQMAASTPAPFPIALAAPQRATSASHSSPEEHVMAVPAADPAPAPSPARAPKLLSTVHIAMHAWAPVQAPEEEKHAVISRVDDSRAPIAPGSSDASAVQQSDDALIVAHNHDGGEEVTAAVDATPEVSLETVTVAQAEWTPDVVQPPPVTSTTTASARRQLRQSAVASAQPIVVHSGVHVRISAPAHAADASVNISSTAAIQSVVQPAVQHEEAVQPLAPEPVELPMQPEQVAPPALQHDTHARDAPAQPALAARAGARSSLQLAPAQHAIHQAARASLPHASTLSPPAEVHNLPPHMRSRPALADFDDSVSDRGLDSVDIESVGFTHTPPDTSILARSHTTPESVTTALARTRTHTHSGSESSTPSATHPSSQRRVRFEAEPRQAVAPLPPHLRGMASAPAPSASHSQVEMRGMSDLRRAMMVHTAMLAAASPPRTPGHHTRAAFFR